MMKNEDGIIAVRLRNAIESSGMSKVELAKKAETSKSIITQYTLGYTEPKRDMVVRLSQALNVNPAWLAGYSEEKNIISHKKENS